MTPDLDAPAPVTASPIPGLTVRVPASVAEAAEVMRAGAAARRTIAFLGGGTDAGLAAAAPVDEVLRTTGLARIVEYAPADQIVVAEAGVTLAALQATLARERQRLALDPLHPDRATLGGIVAANAFGPLRTRYGTSRDLLIGMGMIRADGAFSRSGGKVVKNVAGFDLARLLVGSLGTLGLVAEVAFRVHPLPEVRETVRLARVAPASAWEAARTLRDARLEPAAVVAIGNPGALEVLFAFEGFEAGASAQARRAVEVLRPFGAPERLAPADGGAAWARHDDARAAGTFTVRFSALPSALGAAVAALAPVADALEAPVLAAHSLLGVGFLAGTPTAGASLSAALDRARAALDRAHGHAFVVRCPGPLRAGLDAWGPPPPAIALMRRLKERLDPDGRLAPGSFLGGI